MKQRFYLVMKLKYVAGNKWKMVDITKMNEKLIKSFQVKFPILRLNDHEPSIVCCLWREQQIRCKGQMVSPSFVSKSIVDSDLCEFFFALNIL